MIVLSDDELKVPERRFGPVVSSMGPWNSDGVFGYSAVPVAVVEKAVEAVGDPGMLEALRELKTRPERTRQFIAMVQVFGPPLIEKIAATYRES